MTDVNDDNENSDGFPSRIDVAIKRGGGVTNVSRATGISESVLRKWRAGRSEPTRTNLVKLVQVSGVAIDWLTTGTGSPPGVQEETSHYGRSELSAGVHARLDEIEELLDRTDQLPLSVAGEPRDAPVTRALADLRRFSADESLPRSIRIRAARTGALGFGDEDLARTEQELDAAIMKVAGSRFRQVATELESALEEVGYEPPQLIKEGLKTAMYSHGLTRAGAVTLLQFLQAEAAGRDSD